MKAGLSCPFQEMKIVTIPAAITPSNISTKSASKVRSSTSTRVHPYSFPVRTSMRIANAAQNVMSIAIEISMPGSKNMPRY
jgi:hypothetical protein